MKRYGFTDDDLYRLCEAVQVSRRTLQYPRESRRDMVREAAGRHYSENSNSADVPINFLDLYERVVGRKLISNNPRVMLSTHNKAMKPQVKAAEDWANEEIVRMNVADTLGRLALDALYSVAIARVALADPIDAGNKSWRLSAGTPFLDRIDLDDFVYDTFARDFNEVTFMGHRYRASVDLVNRFFKLKGQQKLDGTTFRMFNQQGDERINQILYGTQSISGEFEDRIDLWEIYVPKYGIIVTLLDDPDGGRPYDGEPLQIRKWIGPDDGPYITCMFGQVIGSALGKGPMQQLYDLHKAMNRSLRKAIRQADRMKETFPVGNNAVEDSARFRAASDGEFWLSENPNQIRPLMSGGPQQALQLFVSDLYEKADHLAGNLSSLAGLSAQSRTATQDKLLAENSSSLMNDMSENFTTFTSKCLRRMNWFWWHHPQKVMHSHYAVQGLSDIGIIRELHPAGPTGGNNPQLRRNGPLPDLNVDPYSLVSQTPQQRLQFLQNLIQQMAPLMPILQQQGVTLNMPKYLELIAKYSNEPDVAEVFSFGSPVQPQDNSQGAPNQPPTMPANTTREYVRHSAGGGQNSNQGRQDMRTQLQAGMRQQASQAMQSGNVARGFRR